MTLHEAIEVVIKDFGRPAKASEIASEVNQRKLYLKSDRTDVTASQVSARVSKYPDIFEVSEQGISLHDISLIPYREFTYQIIDLLRKLYFSDSDTRIRDIVASFLLLIYYKRNNITFTEQFAGNKQQIISAFERFASSEVILQESFSHIYNFISNSISEYDAEQIIRVVNRFRFPQLPAPLEFEFSNFFNDFINSYSWKSNFHGGEFSTPKPISKLICSLFVITERSKVFDPFAGRASLLFEILKSNKSYVKEIIAGDTYESAVSIGTQNLFATGFRNFEYKRGDAFHSWNSSVDADLIISAPPFGSRIENRGYYYPWQRVPGTDLGINAVQLSLYHAQSSNGKIVLSLPESILFNTNAAYRGLREMIVSDNSLRGIILLPKNTFKPYSAASSILLLLDKSRQSKITGVFIYDASDVSITEFEKEIPIITDSFHSETEIRDKARWVDIAEIKKNDYDLSIKKYLLQTILHEDSATLKELTEECFVGTHVAANNLNKEEGMPYIQVGDLNDGEALGFINRSDIKSFISDSELITTSPKTLTPGSILIAKVGTKLKPTIFPGGFDAVASSNVIILRPTKNVLPEYLVSQLQSDYVLKQIEVIRRYNAIPNVNLKGVLGIQIKRKSYEEQQSYVATYYSEKIGVIERQGNKISDDEQYNIISRIKHEVKQPVSSIGIDINILIDYLNAKEKSGELISLSDYVIEPLKGQSDEDVEASKLINVLDRIKSSVINAQDTLKKAEETLNIRRELFKPELIEIKGFVENVVKQLYANVNCKIEIVGKEQQLYIDKYQLKLVFIHLIDNALKHSFAGLDRKKAENILRVELKKAAQKNYFEISVMNNGKPFSTGFNKAFFETKGTTSDRNNGSGFGGYHIRKIIENHKGELEIATNEDVQFSEFKVKFIIYLPLEV